MKLCSLTAFCHLLHLQKLQSRAFVISCKKTAVGLRLTFIPLASRAVGWAKRKVNDVSKRCVTGVLHTVAASAQEKGAAVGGRRPELLLCCVLCCAVLRASGLQAAPLWMQAAQWELVRLQQFVYVALLHIQPANGSCIVPNVVISCSNACWC